MKLKGWVPVLGVQICLLMAVLLFLVALVGAGIDSQGSVLFLISSPMIFLLFGIGFYMVLYLPPERTFLRKALRAQILMVGFFWLLTVAGVQFLSLRWLPEAGAKVATTFFQGVMGLSPYGWIKEKQAYREKFSRELKRSPTEWSLADFSPQELAWERVCVLGPYRDQAHLDGMIGNKTRLMETSRVPYSDSFSALLFLGTDSQAFLVDVSRGSLDFADLDQKCFVKSKAVFYIQRDKNGLPKAIPKWPTEL